MAGKKVHQLADAVGEGLHPYRLFTMPDPPRERRALLGGALGGVKCCGNLGDLEVDNHSSQQLPLLLDVCVALGQNDIE